MPDVAVVGGGVSGMTAAAVLAGHGLSVTLVEKAPSLGPLIRGFTRAGLPCDTGFHLTGGLADGEPLRRYLRFVGVDRYLRVLDAPPEGPLLARCLSPALDITVPEGWGAVRERFVASFPGESRGIDRYLEVIDELYYGLPFVGLTGPYDPRQPVGGPSGSSLQETLDGLCRDRVLRAVLAMPSFLYGVPPAEAPMEIHAGVAASYYRSARSVAGGGRAIVAAFERVLGERGVAVRLGTEADGVVAGERGVEGIRLAGGEVIRCPVVIVTAHPRIALGIAPAGAFRPAMAANIAGLAESMTACVLHAECRGWREAFGRRNLVLMPDCNSVVSPMSVPPASRPLYLAPSPVASPDDAPAGFTVIVPVAPDETAPWRESRHGRRPAGYAAYKASLATAVGRRIAEAFPELDGGFRFVDVATPLSYRDLAHSPFGSLYGAAHRVGQINPLPVTRTRGFLLAGQAVGAPGIMGAMISAFMACGQVVGPDEVGRALEGTA